MTTTTEGSPAGEARTLPRREQMYRDKVVESLRSEFNYSNPMTAICRPGSSSGRCGS